MSRRALPTERKFVTILRADLHRSTDLVVGLELEDAITRLEPALDQMRVAVHQFGGIVYREMGDGLFAIFGAPTADDLHAVKGCHAALNLMQRVTELGDPALGVRVGVHAGVVIAQYRQQDYVQSYDFNGPPLILAERLQSAAEKGQILASKECRELSQGHIAFGAPVTQPLKGFPQPITMHPVEGVAELSKWRVSLARQATLFVNRTEEHALLRSLVQQVEANGKGAAAVLVGEPGVGKSRLAHEAADAMRARGWRLLEVECNPILGAAPFSLLRDLLTALLRDRDIEAQLQILSPTQATALRNVLGLAGANHDAWRAMSPRVRARTIAEATRAVAREAIGRWPTVLMVEDLQWADTASGPALEALTGLLEQLPVLMLATARPEGLPAWFNRLGPVSLPLRALDQAAGREMLDGLLGPSTRLARLKARIAEHTGLLPLFVEEVCRGLVETGAIKGRQGAYEPVGPVAELGVPSTVQGVIAGRIDRLVPEQKGLLQVAATVGPRVPMRILRRIAGLPEALFETALGALAGAAMLLPLGAGATTATFEFPHEMVRQVAYGALLGPDRAALHARTLAALEAEVANGVTGPETAAALAHHAMAAREWTRAADYAATVARQCLERSALPDAMRYFEMAMEAVDQLDASTAREAKAVDLRLEARLAYANFGRVERWLGLAREAEQRAQAMQDGPRQVQALAVRAAALNFSGPALEALEVSGEAMRAAGRLGDPGWQGFTEYCRGQALYMAGRYREAVAVLGQSYERLAVAGAAPPPGTAAQHIPLLCCMMQVLNLAALDDMPAAMEAQARADALATRGGRPFDRMAAGLSRGTLLLRQGDAAAAQAVLAEALGLARQHDVNLFIPILGCQLAMALLQLNQVDEAREVLAEAATEAEAGGQRSLSLRAAAYQALTAPPAEWEAALARLTTVRAAARQEGYAGVELDALLAEARVLKKLAREEDAREAEREAEALATELMRSE